MIDADITQITHYEGESSDSDQDDDFVSDSNFNKNSRQDDFKRELQQTLERAFAEQHTVEIAALELNTLRLAYDAEHNDLREAVVAAVIDQIGTQSVKAVMQQWAALIARTIHSTQDQLATIFHVQNLCVASKRKFFTQILHQMYENDVLEEDIIMQWWNSPKSAEIDAKLRESVLPATNVRHAFLSHGSTKQKKKAMTKTRATSLYSPDRLLAY